MADQASERNTSTFSRRRRKLIVALRLLTEPRTKVSEPEHRRARVLSWLLLTLILLLGVTILLVLIVNRELPDRRNIYTGLISALMTLLLIAFGLNRSGRYTASARLTVACAILGPWLSILLDPSILAGDFVPMTYIVLSVLLTSMLLSARMTVILAAIEFFALLLIPIFDPATASINWASFMAYIFFTSMLGVVSNFMHRLDLEQIDRQTRQLTESEARLRELSVRDSLTGLYNRRYMEETLDKELLRAEQKHLPLGVIMVDMDRFKQFNDTHGHPAGDELLYRMTRALFGGLPSASIACRYGGDEFILILPGVSLEETRVRAESLRIDARRGQAQYEDLPFDPFTLSLGVAAYPDHGLTRVVLLQAADDALYRAKNEGRNRVVVAG